MRFGATVPGLEGEQGMFDLRRLGSHGVRRSVALVTTGALLVVAGLALIWTKAASPHDDPMALASADRVLQSVQVTMSPDGHLTSVDGTVVGTTTAKKQFTSTTQYSPGTAASALPVRVLTSYRTPSKTGTNLSDLNGYNGPLQIQLTVQNLTVKPRTVSYDVDGTQKSRTALVGVPLTVVASTALDGVKPSAVRRQAGDRLAATNGVLSQDQHGVTQVQWATILAPPQMKSSTTLTLALDAHDFKVPDVDVSVEPGLVTDASIGSLIDDTFNPSGSSQLQLEQRTIELIGQVNLVLARAGKTIDRVRSTLNDSADTLGSKTVGDLKSSATSITASVKGLHGSVASLGQDLTASLNGTKSTTVAQLRQMVLAVDQMLGDTSATAPAAQLSGTGCEATVPGAQKADSVYGNLLQVVGQLDGYAKATGSCKDALKASILKTVGPAKPDAASCTGSTSVTCSLLGAENQFAGIADQLVTDGNTALNALDPAISTDLGTASTNLDNATQQVIEAAKTLGNVKPLNGDSGLQPLRAAMKEAHNAADGLKAAIDSVNGQATAGQRHEADLGDLNDRLAAQICTMEANNALTPSDATTLRAYVTSTDCSGAATGGVPPDPNVPPGQQVPVDPMDKQITAQKQAWTALATDTNTSDVTSETGAPLDQLNRALGDVDTAITNLGNSSGDQGDLKKNYDALMTTITRTGTPPSQIPSLAEASSAVDTQVGRVQKQQQDLAAAVQKAFADAATNTKAQAQQAVDPQIRQVTEHVTTDSDALGAMFDRSSAGLSAAATAIEGNGARAIDEQRGQFVARQKSASDQISSSVAAGLSQIGKGVSASTRDMAAANSLLSRDLQHVLLDLGTRRVKGSGLLGSMSTGAATANSAGYQLALASRTASSYANVRQSDVAGILLRQAETDTAMKLQEQLPAFRLKLPDSASHRTVYSFHVRGDG